MEKVWSVTKVYARSTFDSKPNVVSAVEWKLTYTSETGMSVSTGGISRVELPTLNSPFVNYDELSQDQLISWVKARFEQSTLDAIDRELTIYLIAKEHPPTVVVTSKLPWATVKGSQ